MNSLNNMKLLLPLIQTKIGKAIFYSTIVALGNFSLQTIQTQTPEIGLDPSFDFSHQKAEWTLEYYQEILRSSSESLRDLIDQKEEYIKMKGKDWYEQSLAELKNKIQDYQLKLKEYQTQLIDTEEIFKDVHLYPELYKLQQQASHVTKISQHVKRELETYPLIYGETEDYNNSLKGLQYVVGAKTPAEQKTVEDIFRVWYKELQEGK